MTARTSAASAPATIMRGTILAEVIRFLSPKVPGGRSRRTPGLCARALRVQPQSEHPGRVGAEALDACCQRCRQLRWLRQAHAVARRCQHRRRKAGEGQVGGGEAVATEVAAPVRQAICDPVESAPDPRLVLSDRLRAYAELA